MTYHYTLSFTLETDASPVPVDQAAIEYLMGALPTPPTSWPAAEFFAHEGNRVPLDAGFREHFPQACELRLTRLLNTAAGHFNGYRLVIQVPGLALNECWPVQQFVMWLAQFSPDDGPVGFQYSPEMPGTAPTCYFIFNRQLYYDYYVGTPKAFPSGVPMSPSPYVD